MPSTLFISDLHLAATRPLVTRHFTAFLAHDARRAAALYILGDLFDYWVGDDQLDHDPLAREVADALKQLSLHVPVFLMHGNRDFLIGARFAREAGITLLSDPATVEINGQRVLLLHGDTLCTGDTAYQQFRTQARDPAWQRALLGKSYAERLRFAQEARMRSTAEKSLKAEDIMDVTPAAVTDAFRQHDVRLMIHGHTHRPDTHTHEVDGKRCTRWVLADWHDKAECRTLG